MKDSMIIFRFRNRLSNGKLGDVWCGNAIDHWTIMKRVAFATLLIFINIQMQGQVRFGIKGGMNMSNFDMSSKQGIVVDFSNRFAFHAGGFAEIPIGGFFSVQPELLFSSKGAHCEISETFSFPPTTGKGNLTQITKQTYAPGIIELPVYLKAGFEAGPGKFIVGVGPYVAYGVGGKMKAKMKMTIPNFPPGEPDKTIAVGKGKMDVFKTDKLKMRFTNIDALYSYDTEVEFDKALLKRFDYGLSGFVGYELNLGIFISAGFQKGLYNIDNYDEEGDKLKNKTITLSVGYKF